MDLIVVRNGAWMGPPARFWRDAVDSVFDPVVAVARSKAPHPKSAVIRGASFSPESTIVRKAIDSDNWPTTWGDGDEQYTAYEGGAGFEPYGVKLPAITYDAFCVRRITFELAPR